MRTIFMFVSIIFLLISASFIMGDNLFYLIPFYFSPKKFLSISPRYYEKTISKYNVNKEKYKDTDNITVNYYRVRKRILRTFAAVLFILIYSLFCVYLAKKK